MTYSFDLVDFTSIKTKLKEGWEPMPDMEPVYRHVNIQLTLTYVWMRKREASPIRASL